MKPENKIETIKEFSQELNIHSSFPVYNILKKIESYIKTIKIEGYIKTIKIENDPKDMTETNNLLRDLIDKNEDIQVDVQLNVK